MKTITIELYEYDELNEKGQENALAWWSEASSGDEWWENTYEDAERVGITIKGFDLERGQLPYIDGLAFHDSAEATIKLILAEHGKDCDTFKTAQDYAEKFDNLGAEPDNDTAEDYDALTASWEEQREKIAEHFTEAIKGDYEKMLHEELEYIQSRENCEENIRANEYAFTAEGKRMD